MAANNKILEIRFIGENINPESVRAKEIAKLIIAIEESILNDIKSRNPAIDTDQLLFPLSEIKNKSIGLRFVPKLVPDIVVGSFLAISTSFETGDFSPLTNSTIEKLKTLTRFAKDHNCSGEFNIDGEKVSSFTHTTEIPYNKNALIKSDIKLFGRILDAGGKNPNVHIIINDNQEFIFSTNENNAKLLAHKLYEKVNLFGTATWDSITYEIKDFKLKDILDFVPGKTSDALSELRRLSSGYWDKFNSNDDINKQLLRD